MATPISWSEHRVRWSQTDEGAAFVYHGGPDGLSATATGRPWRSNGLQFRTTARTAGDVNGDGYSDVVIGADAYDHGEVDEGVAFLFYGSPHGLGIAPAWMGESNQSGAMFGYWVSMAGDVNGDGYSDVIIGARTFTDTIDRQGKAYLYYGSPAGLRLRRAGQHWARCQQPTSVQSWAALATSRRRLRRYHRRVRRLGRRARLGPGPAYVWCGSPLGCLLRRAGSQLATRAAVPLHGRARVRPAM